MKRLILSACVSLAITCGIFWGMQSLISVGRAAVSEGTPQRIIEFVRLKRHAELELKKRHLPERVQPKAQPASPSLEVSPRTNAAPSVQPFNSPVSHKANRFNLQGGLLLAAPTDRDIVPIIRVRPMYPRRAAQRRIEGWVEVEFQISKTGAVQNAKVTQSQPSGVFDRAALRAIRKWKYKPQLSNSAAVVAEGVVVRLKFELGQE